MCIVHWDVGHAFPSKDWRSLTFGAGVFVAVGAWDNIMSSENGVDWQQRQGPGMYSRSWACVTYGNGLFVAVGNDNNAPVATSEDAMTWEVQEPARDIVGHSWFSLDWQSVTYGGGRFVTVGKYNDIMSSENGLDWTARTLHDGNDTLPWQSVAWGDGCFVAVGETHVTTSEDGLNWSTQMAQPDAPGSNVTWDGVCWGNGLFVAVGIPF